MTRRLRALFSSLALVATLAHAHQDAPARMRMHFIDVGQGSATLLEFKCGAVLIDTGAASKTHPAALEGYLEKFFRLRPDLNRTLKAVYLTHCHADHAFGLATVAKRFRVERYLDDGIRKGSGLRFLSPFLAYAADPAHPSTVVGISDAEVRAVPDGLGLTNEDIDPLACDECDPRLSVLAGGIDPKPTDWSKTAFENLNNHSLVIRAELGGASLLVTGDLETHGIRRLTGHYGGTGLLDADVLVAGHHGAENGLSPELVRLASPAVGIISCGRWDAGKGGTDRFTTWWYGHPNEGAVKMLARGVERARPPLNVKVGQGGRKFVDFRLDRAVYCTGWDGTVVVDAFSDGQIAVRDHGLDYRPNPPAVNR